MLRQQDVMPTLNASTGLTTTPCVYLHLQQVWPQTEDITGVEVWTKASLLLMQCSLSLSLPHTHTPLPSYSLEDHIIQFYESPIPMTTFPCKSRSVQTVAPGPHLTRHFHPACQDKMPPIRHITCFSHSRTQMGARGCFERGWQSGKETIGARERKETGEMKW